MSIYFSHHSKYNRWYSNIIKSAQNRTKSKNTYYEKHHIVPKSLGGNDEPDNIVSLTYREHLLCHWLLCKFTEGENKAKMTHAFWAMCNLVNSNHQRVPSLRVLESAKKAHAKTLSEKMSGEGNPMFGRAGFAGKKHSQNHIEKMSGDGNPMFGKTHSDDAKQKISKALKGKKRKPFSEETRRKMSLAAKNRKSRTNHPL